MSESTQTGDGQMSGRIAYRFTVGERRQRWLGSALRRLLGERKPEI